MAEQEYTPTEAEMDAARDFIERRDAVPGGIGTLEEFAVVLAAHDAEVRADERAKRPDREQIEAAARAQWRRLNDRAAFIAGAAFAVAAFPDEEGVLALEPEAREEPTREQLSEFLMALYDHGTNPNALREADAILHFLGRRPSVAREVTDAEVEAFIRASGTLAPRGRVRAGLEAVREVSR